MQDQDRQRSDDHVYESQPGLAAVADDVEALLESLTEEVAATRHRYDDALAQIEARIGQIEQSPPADRTAAAQPSTAKDHDDPWDDETTEAFVRAHEGEGVLADAAANAGDKAASEAHAAGLADLPQRIMAALAEMRPDNTLAALEDRFGTFEARIAAAVADVAKRSDVDGLHLIEAHLGEVGGRLDHVESQLDKLGAMESALRALSDQLSDERLGSLLASDHRVAADLEMVARTAAEEMHARFAETAAARGEEIHRQEEIKALIESSIREQRRGDDELNAVFSDLGVVVHHQIDRYEALHALIEDAIGEQRKGEEQMLGMLDTLQQALVQVLDRIDTLEAAPAVASATAQAAAPAAQQTAALPDVIELPGPAPAAPAATSAPVAIHETGLGVAHVLTDPETVERWDRPATPLAAVADAQPPAAEDAPAPTADEMSAEPAPEPEPEPEPEPVSPIERMRRELLADAQRARLKAAARANGDAASAGDATESPLHPAGRPTPSATTTTAALRATPVKAAPVPKGAPRTILGLSPKLLASALALVVAINGGLLLLSRGREAPSTQTPPGASSSAAPAASGAAVPQTPDKHSEIGDGGSESELAAADAFAFETRYPNDTGAAASSGVGTLPVPHGVTVVEPAEPPPLEDQVMLYEQQVTANLSSELGVKVANASLTELLPEEAGRKPDVAGAGVAPGRVGVLDLPPLTVGPLSLRLAAANGDASAQFEVGARLAEGKGTGQDFKEALRWYQRSAAQGFAQAQYRLGTLFERGLGTEADVGRARVWYQRAAEQGNVKAMHNLAVLAAGPEQSSPDYVEAARWFAEAAESGLADSQYNLGVLCENGLGVAQSTEMAFKWYSLAAAAGDQEAAKRRDQLKTLLSPDELAAAAKLVSAFQAKPRAALANDPRAAGQDWQRRQTGASGDDT